MSKDTTKKEAVKKEKKLAWDIYTDEEKKVFKTLTTELSSMRDLLRKELVEFDNKTFLQQYEDNRKADLAYNEQVVDEEDFRMTTGLTREKDTTILSTLLNLNLQPNITAFDRDNNLIAELGTEMEDLVKKSREIEMYPEKRTSIYREMIAQGVVYVEEVYTERSVLKKSETDWLPKMKIADFKGDNTPIYDVESKCEAKLHLGKYVLFSSMNEEELQNNAIFALYEEVDRDVAQSIYGEWDRWDLVPEEVTREEAFKDNVQSNSGSDYTWNVYKVAKGKVGILKVFKRFSNKYMIMLNGVMMLPCDFPMTKVSPSGLYPIAKGILERIPNFAIGKGVPSKTKVDQKMYDTLLRAMLGKAWQSYKPALGNRSGNVLSRDILKSNSITHGIKQNDIFTILPQQMLAITNGDVSMFEMVKQVINEKSVTDSYAAQTMGDDATATEVINQQKQTMLKMAAAIDGIRALERRMILLRIYNIITNWTKYEESPYFEEVVEVKDGIATITGKQLVPEKKNKSYKKYTANTTFPDGKQGVKISQFVGLEEPLPSVREQVDIEEKMSKEYGKPVRISYINAEWLRVLEAIWNVDTIVSTDNDDQMQLLVYMDNLTRIANMFGVQIFKQDYVLQRIATKMKEDYEKMFAVSDADLGQLLGQINGENPTQVSNPAQQVVNSRKPTPLSTAKVS